MKKLSLFCCAAWAAFTLAAAPQALFDLARDAGKFRAQDRTRLQLTQEGVLCTKDNLTSNWGGLNVSDFPVEQYAGQAVRVSGRILVKELTPAKPEAAAVNGIIWFQENAPIRSFRERLQSGGYFSIKEAGQEVEFSKVFRVPANAKFLTLYLTFNYATGSYLLKELKVEAVSADAVTQEPAKAAVRQSAAKPRPKAAVKRSASGGRVFDLARDAEMVKTQDQVKLERTSEGLLCTKDNLKSNWGGLNVSLIPVEKLAGQAVRVSGRIKVNDLKSASQRLAAVNGVIWFQDKERISSYKERIANSGFFSVKEPDQEITFDKTFLVPANAKYMTLYLTFNYATGSYLLKELKVEAVSSVAVERRTPSAPEKVLMLQKGKSATIILSDGKKKAALAEFSFTPQGFDLRVKAFDKVHRQPYADRRIWQGDSLQFSADPLLDRKVMEYNPVDDVEYGLALPEGKEPFFLTFTAPADYPPPVARIRYAVRRDEGNGATEYTLHLPWAAFGPFLYDKMDRFGANVLLNCSNGSGRTAVEWRPATNMGKRPVEMATILLDKGNRGIMAELYAAAPRRYSGQDYVFKAAVASEKAAQGRVTVTCNGKKVYDEKTLFAQGETDFDFTLPDALFRKGENAITLEFSDAKGVFYAKIFKVSQFSQEERLALIKTLQERCAKRMAEVTPLMKPFDSRAAFPREQYAAWRISRLFLELFIPEDLARKDYALALRELQEIDAALAKLQEEMLHKHYTLSRLRSVMDLQSGTGSLVGKDGPVFAFGMHYANGMRRLTAQDFRDMSMNYDAYCVSPIRWGVFPKDPEGKPSTRSVNFHRVNWRTTNTTSTPLIMTYGFPNRIRAWRPDAIVNGNHFLEYDPDHPKMREMVDAFVYGAFKDLADQENPILRDAVAFDLWNEPCFESVSPYTVKAYQDFLKKRYGTIEKYNRCYKSSFKSFDEITDIRGKMAYLPVASYDYCSFNNQRFYDFHKIVRDAARRGAGGKYPIRFAMKQMNGHFCGTFYTAHGGYDMELIADLTDLHGGDTGVREKNVEAGFTFNWRTQCFVFDLQKSIAPQQPIVDNEYHAAATSADMVSAAFILGAHHGLNAASWWAWSRDDKMYFRIRDKGAMPYWFPEAPDGNPAAMIAGTQTAILMDRLMEEVQPFYAAPRPVRLFWSQSSINFIGSNNAVPLWRAYDKVSFAGLPVGFLTERQLLAGKIPSDLKILVITGTPYAEEGVPAALEKLEKAGVCIVRIGKDQITRNTFDEPLTAPRLKRRVEPTVAGWDLVRELNAAGVTEIARLAGTNRDKVEVRFVKYGSRTLGYAVNAGTQKARLRVTDLQGKTLTIKTRGEMPKRTMTSFELAPRGWLLFEIASK